MCHFKALSMRSMRGKTTKTNRRDYKPIDEILQGYFIRVDWTNHVEYFILDVLECYRLLAMYLHLFLYCLQYTAIEIIFSQYNIQIMRLAIQLQNFFINT